MDVVCEKITGVYLGAFGAPVIWGHQKGAKKKKKERERKREKRGKGRKKERRGQERKYRKINQHDKRGAI